MNACVEKYLCTYAAHLGVSAVGNREDAEMAIIWAEGEGLVHLFLAQHAHLVQALRPRGVHLTVVQLVNQGPELRIRVFRRLDPDFLADSESFFQ